MTHGRVWHRSGNVCGRVKEDIVSLALCVCACGVFLTFFFIIKKWCSYSHKGFK